MISDIATKRIRIAIGAVTISLVSEFPEMAAAAAVALPSKHVQVTQTPVHDGADRLSIRIHRASGRAETVSPDASVEWKSFRFLDGVVYRYDPKLQRYYIEAPFGISGRLDYQAGVVEWWMSSLPSFRLALDLLILSPLSLMLQSRDILICHAAALQVDDSAALMFGPSSSGKSTTCFLAGRGGEDSPVACLCDDSVILDFNHDTPHAYPISTGFGLSPEIASRHGLSADGHNVLVRESSKIYFRRVPGQQDSGGPISRVLFLSKSPENANATVAERLTSGIALQRFLASQTSIPNPGLVRRVELAARLLRVATAFELHYREFCDPDVVRAILLDNGGD